MHAWAQVEFRCLRQIILKENASGPSNSDLAYLLIGPCKTLVLDFARQFGGDFGCKPLSIYLGPPSMPSGGVDPHDLLAGSIAPVFALPFYIAYHAGVLIEPVLLNWQWQHGVLSLWHHLCPGHIALLSAGKMLIQKCPLLCCFGCVCQCYEKGVSQDLGYSIFCQSEHVVSYWSIVLARRNHGDVRDQLSVGTQPRQK